MQAESSSSRGLTVDEASNHKLRQASARTAVEITYRRAPRGGFRQGAAPHLNGGAP